jgi:hypothetical protein
MGQGRVWTDENLALTTGSSFSCDPGDGEEGMLTVIHHEGEIELYAADASDWLVATKAENTTLAGNQTTYVAEPCTHTKFIKIKNVAAGTVKVSIRGWKTYP